MAKGQRRSNREVKKPKKERSASNPAPQAGGMPWPTLEKMKSQEHAKKK